MADTSTPTAGRPSFPRRAVITGGMPYGNKNLHFGHIGGVFVPADFFARFLRDRHLTEDDAVHLMRTVPDRMHTLLPGLVIADLLTERFALSSIAYSDSGVREGYIYDRILKESSRRTI